MLQTIYLLIYAEINELGWMGKIDNFMCLPERLTKE